MSAPLTIKEILSSPAAMCKARWGETPLAEEQHRKAIDLIAQISSHKTEIKKLRNEKQMCSKEFGKAKTAAQSLENLKYEMHLISQNITRVEQQHRIAEELLIALFSEATKAAPSLPARFQPPEEKFAGPVSITQIDDTTQTDWDAYVDSHPQASLYHKYQWRKVIRESFAHESFYFVASDSEGSIRGILPLVRLRSRLFGDFAVSLPFYNYGGPLTDSEIIAKQLLHAAAQLGNSLQLKHLEIRATTPLTDWPARTDKASMILALPTSGELLDQRLGSKLRAQIKRGQQASLKVEVGHIELLEQFYDVFAHNMRDLGTPVYSYLFFANILEAWPKESRIIVIKHNGKPVSAAFLLGFRDTLEIPWASTLRSANGLNINMVLYRQVLELAISCGYAFFDFGRSTINAGTFKFKKQWGAQPVAHYWHYWLPHNAQLPELKPDATKFRLLVAVWRQLPLAVANALGPHIVKYLP